MRELLGFLHQLPTQGSQSPSHSVGSGKVNRIPAWNYEFIFKVRSLSRHPLRHVFHGFTRKIPSARSVDYFSPSLSPQVLKTIFIALWTLNLLRTERASEVHEKDNRINCHAIAECWILVKKMAFFPTSLNFPLMANWYMVLCE